VSIRLAALAFVFLALPGAASAASVDVLGVDASSYPRIRMTVVTATPTSFSPRVAELGGRVAGVHAFNLGAGASIVLAVDRSGSMAGAPLASAAAAARLFVARKGTADRIALVAFGSQADELTRFSADPGDALRALAGLEHDRQTGTALYDALRLSATALAAEPPGARVILLLTDGRDRSAGASLESAIAAARHAGAIVYPIGVQGVGLSEGPLVRMARATGGRYTPASGGQLEAAYARSSEELRRTWLLEYVTSARPGERIRASVWVPGLGSATAAATLPGSAPGAVARPSALVGSAVGDVLLALVVGVLVFGMYRALAAWRRGRWLRRRLAAPRTVAEPAPRRSLRERLSASFAGVLGATEQLAGRFARWRALEQLLERSRVPLRAVELLYVMLGSGFGLALFAALFGPPAAVILLALVTGSPFPLGLVVVRARRRRRAFEDQLPDLLLTLASGLKAGQSFRQGIQTVVDEGQEPAVGEFELVLNESRLGRPLEAALRDMGERLGSKDFSFVVSAVTIQRQAGGSLAGIFDMVADAVRERQQFARRIKALTATGRMSAYVLVALPIGLALALTAINGAYMAPLYSTPLGRAMIVGGLTMMAVGAVILRKIVAFKG
jgi:tight adherence protein B